MVMEENQAAEQSLLLRSSDFPKEYVEMAHPDDYKEFSEFKPQFIVHDDLFSHKFLARVAWKTSEGTVVPMTFVCDTGLPEHIYLSRKAIDVLSSKGLFVKNELEGLAPFLRMHRNKTSVFTAAPRWTPHPIYTEMGNANILGAKALSQLHFRLEDNGFSFDPDFEYL